MPGAGPPHRHGQLRHSQDRGGQGLAGAASALAPTSASWINQVTAELTRKQARVHTSASSKRPRLHRTKTKTRSPSQIRRRHPRRRQTLLPPGRSCHELYSGVDRVLHDRRRCKEGLPVPPKFVEAVQGSYNYFSVDSLVFKKPGGGRDEELFYSPEGKGSGWAVNHRCMAARKRNAAN